MLDKMFEQFKTVAEMQEFAEAQQATILQQQKKIKELQDELAQLKKSGQVIPINASQNNIISLSDEESISRMELEKLRNDASVRALTLEEARKVEIYTKIINASKAQKKPDTLPVKNLKSEDLLKQLGSSDE